MILNILLMLLRIKAVTAKAPRTGFEEATWIHEKSEPCMAPLE